MDSALWKAMVEYSADGFAYHKLVCDENDRPCDYEFIALNPAYESLINLKADKVIGRRATEVLPGGYFQDFNWVSFFARVALQQISDEHKYYSPSLSRWFHIRAYSPQKYYFFTQVRDITSEMEKLEEQETINTAFNDVIFVLNEEYEFINIYAADDCYLFMPREEIIGKSIHEIVDGKLAAEFVEAFARAFDSGQKQRVEYKLPLSGVQWWYEAEIMFRQGLLNESKYIVVGRDHSEKKRNLKRAEQSIYEEKERLRVTLRSIGDAAITTDKFGAITDINTVAEKLTGWAAADACGRPLQEVFHIVHGITREACEDPVQCVLQSGEICELDSETMLITKDDREVHIADSAAPIRNDDGDILGVILVFRDVSEEKQKQERIAYLSYHDSLTGLYNRRFFEEQLDRLDTPRNYPLTIIVGDVNGLKLTNDAFGHLIGDDLLKQAAAILQEACRADDIIARWGGDEFVILLPNASLEDAQRIIKRIKNAMDQIELVPINLSISFGSHSKVTPEADILDILKSAEDDMYKNKLLESQEVVGEIIAKIVDTLHVAAPREKLHAQRVAQLCSLTGKAMGFSQEKIKQLETTGYMHDVGKIAIPGSILSKSGELTEEEWREIKRHPEVGYRILSSYNETADIADFVLAHHERVDGSGYPKGLKGPDIPLEAKILSVADTFAAMTGEGHYKKPVPAEDAAAELKAKAGTQLDSDVVQVFVEKVLNMVN
ncbi:HD domain-containing phosphohydrolase [Dethiobacter alkaliphilus]|uniref:HD domain-containing phosphohydrolase n=1 Tax=Dethiobacter alkaliphilus TaxID=427926 RepID=UPI002226C031|nr:HD domain-containing phosphohydrolase [Dethiobacter alkaliphilus]MCW3489248.1 diguanylate cyclase [Dethiobacter alkaliphilus]